MKFRPHSFSKLGESGYGVRVMYSACCVYLETKYTCVCLCVCLCVCVAVVLCTIVAGTPARGNGNFVSFVFACLCPCSNAHPFSPLWCRSGPSGSESEPQQKNVVSLEVEEGGGETMGSANGGDGEDQIVAGSAVDNNARGLSGDGGAQGNAVVDADEPVGDEATPVDAGDDDDGVEADLRRQQELVEQQERAARDALFKREKKRCMVVQFGFCGGGAASVPSPPCSHVAPFPLCRSSRSCWQQKRRMWTVFKPS